MSPIAATEITARFGPADREPLPYAVLPFEVASGRRALRVTLSYDGRAASPDAEAGNIVDLGLLGPGPTDPGAATFRGWSGSERSSVVVGESSATPGYRPGPIDPGTWHVLLGLYKITPSGCRATVNVEEFVEAPAIPGGVSAVLPRRVPSGAPVGVSLAGDLAARGPTRWIPADLHAHTLHSDGAERIGVLADRARQAGLEAVFVTDHNTDAHLPELDEDHLPALLPGEEVTTYRGHLNALGIERWVEFRRASPQGIARTIAEIHAQDALASVNHPKSPGIEWLHGRDLDVDCVEVWNGPWSTEDDEAIGWWESILDSGRRVTAVGGSDTHGPGRGKQPVGTPTTWIRADGPDRSSLLRGIRAGRVVLTRDPLTPPPALWVAGHGRRVGIGETLGVGDEEGPITVSWAVTGVDTPRPVAGTRGRWVRLIVDGVARQDVPAPSALEGTWIVPHRERLARVRLEIRTGDGELVALTNHVFLEDART